MNPLVVLLTLSLKEELAKLVADELDAGSDLNVAVGKGLAAIEAHIPDPAGRAVADKVLRSLVTVGESLAAKALGVTPAAAPAPAPAGN